MSKKIMKKKEEELVQVNDTNQGGHEIIGEKENNPSTILLNGILALVKEKYGVGENYTLLGFKDSQKKVQVNLSTEDFELDITITGNTLFYLKNNLGLLEE